MITERELTLDPSIFRAYDIRGIVGESLTEPVVHLLGQAFGSLVRSKGGNQVIVARDGRLSGPVLMRALCEGIVSAGCDVVNLGMVPTPVLYYAVHLLEQASGVMLTGSHNPSNYNGLKIVLQGAALTESGIQALHQRVQEKRFYDGCGKQHEVDLLSQYVKQMVQQIKLERPLSVVIDAGNGVAGMLAPALFRALGCDVHELFCEVDGLFPNHHPDPAQPENLQDLIKAVQLHQADIGLAFDGDGDRLGGVTQKGDIICPDRLLMLYARPVLLQHPGASIIYDVKCTSQLGALIASLGGEPLMWKTGHSFIKAKMAEIHAPLAGEMSGHFFFHDRWYGFDDALYAGARLLEILSQQPDSHSLFAAIPDSVNTPELKVSVSEAEKFSLMQLLI